MITQQTTTTKSSDNKAYMFTLHAIKIAPGHHLVFIGVIGVKV